MEQVLEKPKTAELVREAIEKSKTEAQVIISSEVYQIILSLGHDSPAFCVV